MSKKQPKPKPATAPALPVPSPLLSSPPPPPVVRYRVKIGIEPMLELDAASIDEAIQLYLHELCIHQSEAIAEVYKVTYDER